MASEDGRVEEIMSLVMGYRATVRALPPPPMSSVPRQLLDAEIKAEEAVLAAVQALAAERDAMVRVVEAAKRIPRPPAWMASNPEQQLYLSAINADALWKALDALTPTPTAPSPAEADHDG